MSEDQAVVVGVSSRRSACDRCRLQKLRCLRERPAAEQEQCDRCARSHAPCVTSPIYRMRTQIAVSGSRAPEPKRQRHDEPKQASSGSFASQHEPGDLLLPVSMSTGAAIESVTAESTVPWDEWSSSTLLSPDLWAENVPWDIGEAPFNTSTFTARLDSAFTSVASTSNSSTASYTESSSAFASVFSPLLSQASTLSAEKICESHLDSPLQFAATTAGKPDIEDKSRQAGETYTQRLSSINSDLITQLRRISQGPFTMTLERLIRPEIESHCDLSANRARDIVKGTYEFIQVLKLLADQYLLPTTKSPSEACSLRESSSSTSTLFESMSPRSTVGRNPPITTSDPATSLLILTCYIHLLRVYILLFESIGSLLKQVADSEEPSLQPAPGLSFSYLALGML